MVLSFVGNHIILTRLCCVGNWLINVWSVHAGVLKCVFGTCCNSRTCGAISLHIDCFIIVDRLTLFYVANSHLLWLYGDMVRPAVPCAAYTVVHIL